MSSPRQPAPRQHKFLSPKKRVNNFSANELLMRERASFLKKW